MMIGRFENMDITEDWRIQEQQKAKRERRLWFFLFLLSLVTLVATYPHFSWADVQHYITVDGRTEPADCYVEYTQPSRTVCVSESFVCITRDDLAQTFCTVKR